MDWLTVIISKLNEQKEKTKWGKYHTNDLSFLIQHNEPRKDPGAYLLGALLVHQILK